MTRAHEKKRKPAELSFIAELAQRAKASGKSSMVTLGIGDDCALLRPPRGHSLAITTDFSLEGRHFLRKLHPAQAVGHRALARGLSDLAAMGATPLAAFLSLALPARVLHSNWPLQFLDGLLALARTHNVPLAGGDTAHSPADLILADIVLIGSVPAGRALLRSGAKPGDALYVSGTLGGAAAELAELQHSPKKFARLAATAANHPHLYPQPRIALGKSLLTRKLATSCIDLSDGLSTDLAHLCESSNVRAIVDTAALPIAPNATLEQALHGGEDYELLFTAPATLHLPKKIAGVAITRIGHILPRNKRHPQAQLRNAAGRLTPLAPAGYEHFR